MFLIVVISSNINEVIKTILNLLLFLRKHFTRAKKHQKASKAPNAPKAQKAQKRNQAKAQKRK